MRDRPIRILELRSVRGTGGGPEKTILMGAGRTDPQRFAVTVCYIRDGRDRVFSLDQLAARLGVDYEEITERHSFDPTIWPALRRLVRNRQIDIVHAHEYKTDLLALLLTRAERVTPLATVHGWTGHSLRERLLYYPADRWLVRSFPRIIAVSSEIRGALIRAGVPSERISTVLNGIDPEVFRRDPDRMNRVRAQFGLTPTATVIGSLGRLEHQKRFDLLIAAVAELRRTGTEVTLLLVGDGSLRAKLADLANERGVAEACIFAGHRSDVIDVLHAFDVFVQSSDYEGTPNAVLEAMAVETPIVATTAGGTAELVTDEVHGLLVRPGSPRALAAAIRRTLDEGDATARRTRAARQRVERELSFATRMRTVERIYEELAGPRTATAQPARVMI